MNAQEPIVKKGTRMTCGATSGHAAAVVGIRKDGVECILEDGRLVTVNFQSIERAVDAL